MHGLIHCALRALVSRSAGPRAWQEVARRAGPGLEEPEAMRLYPDAETEALVAAATEVLGKPREALIEDLGASLPTHEGLRRLLRFGGATFQEFLLSLTDLAGRAALAVDTLRLPEISLERLESQRLTLRIGPGLPGYDNACAGLIRAMADDYGALALVELKRTARGGQGLVVELLDTEFAAGRAFALAGGPE